MTSRGETGASAGDSVSCAQCGTTVAAAPISWSFESDLQRGGRYVCDRCVRTNLRAIEAKLEQQWW